VDRCEREASAAFKVNAATTYFLSKTCKHVGSAMIYISTDYVFNGERPTPYQETDFPDPINVYGLSKWMGEEFVQSTLPESYIVRTSCLFGGNGNNFINTMARFALQNKKIRVVDDQISSVTYVNDLAKAIYDLIDCPRGIYHVCNTGSCSRFELAKMIYVEMGANPEKVLPVSSEEYGAYAKRPLYSVLNTDKFHLTGKKMLQPWQNAVSRHLREAFHD
jgi:dTDP-4-dehydrorhamnose reductase